MTLQRAALLAVAVLAVAHQDTWLWDEATLIAGVVPAGLAYHATFSVVAASVWWAVTTFAWPEDPFAATPDAAPPEASP